jgi:hypothetical protein
MSRLFLVILCTYSIQHVVPFSTSFARAPGAPTPQNQRMSPKPSRSYYLGSCPRIPPFATGRLPGENLKLSLGKSCPPYSTSPLSSTRDIYLMPQSAPSTGSNTASQPPMYHASYLASMLCDDEPSIVLEKERGIFRRLVEVKVDNEDLIWSAKGNDEPDNPFVPTVSSTYLHTAEKEPGGAGGFYDKYSLTNGHDSLLRGISAYLVCNREPTGWQSLSPGERGPWKRDATLYVSLPSS